MTDGELTDTATVALAVSAVNDAPVLEAIGSRDATEGQLLSFTVDAGDVEGDTLTFSLGEGAPAGAGITSTGLFTWTPTWGQGPASYQVTVVVTDSGSPQLPDSETFTISVWDDPDVTINGGDSSDTFRLVRDGGDADVYHNGMLVFSQSLSTLTSLSFGGGGGSDTLIVDFEYGQPDATVWDLVQRR